MSRNITVIILFLAVATVTLPAQINATSNLGECQTHALPPFIQNYLRQHSGRWRIQEPKDLGPRAHERWTAEKPLGCPGIVSGNLESTNELSYAILLVPATKGAKGYKLVVFNPDAAMHRYQATVVDQAENSESAAFFIHAISIGGFFDPQSQKKFQVQAQKGILFIDASEKEYEADVYFWGAGKYHSQPIDY